MIKYKLYTHSGVMYVVPIDKYEYIDDIAESYFEDYCAGLLTTHELDSFVEEAILDNGVSHFNISEHIGAIRVLNDLLYDIENMM